MTEFRTLLLQIPPHRIGFIKFILEGYDGMALVSTIDAKSGSIIIRYPLPFHDDLVAIIANLSPLLFSEQAPTQTAQADDIFDQEGRGAILAMVHH